MLLKQVHLSRRKGIQMADLSLKTPIGAWELVDAINRGADVQAETAGASECAGSSGQSSKNHEQLKGNHG